MATPIAFNGTLIPFKEFMMSESVRPRQTNYGINDDLNNNKIFNSKILNHYITFFKSKNSKENLYLVSLSYDNEFSFGSLKNKQYIKDNAFDVNSIINDLSDAPKGLNSPGIKIFSEVMYVMMEMVVQLNLDRFFFSSAHDKLGLVYDKLVQNKYFLEDVKNLGYEYIGKEKTEYYFTKKRDIMKIWYIIKCWFGYCLESDIIKSKEKQNDNDTDVNEVKEEVPEAVRKVIKKSKEDAEDKVSVTNVKKKRAWFNNGKEQELVQIEPIDESLSLPDGWVKGKLKKGVDNE